MAGSFDDLIPKSSGSFDDLIPVKKQNRGALGATKDFLLSGGSAVNKSLQGLSDVFGADNGVSQFFRGNAETLDSQLSPAAQATNKENQAELDQSPDHPRLDFNSQSEESLDS